MYGQSLSGVGDSQLTSAEVPRIKTDIENAFSRLSESISELEQKFDVLRKKLSPVMMEVPVNPSENKDGCGGSPMACEVESRNQRIKNLNREVSFVLDSLQL